MYATLPNGFARCSPNPSTSTHVTVLLGLMLCEGARTLSGLLEQIADRPSLAGLSRFLSQAPWEEATVAESWLRHFREEMEPKVAAELERERQIQPKRRGRPKAPVVTGYLIGDDEGVAQAQSPRRWRDWAGIIRRPKTNACAVIAWSRVCLCCWGDAVPWLPRCIDSKKSVKWKASPSRARSS